MVDSAMVDLADERPSPGPNLVASLLHGLAILDMFDRSRRVIGIGEMAAHLGLHKSSASRLAATLASVGYLKATSPGNYRLDTHVAAVGRLVEEDTTIEQTVMPYLQRLTWLTGETGHLAQLDGADARTVAIVDGWHTVRMHSWVGKTSAAYCTSTGKVLLAGLSKDEIRALYPGKALRAMTDHTLTSTSLLLDALADVREKGYALDDEELVLGLRCISAPVVGQSGDVVASISISGPTQRLGPEVEDAVAAHVRWAAAAASNALGASPTTPAGWPIAPDSEPPRLPWIEQVRPANSRESMP